MTSIFEKSKNHSLTGLSKGSMKAYFVKGILWSGLVFSLFVIDPALASECREISHEVLLEDSDTNQVPIITSAKLIAPGVLEIQFKAPSVSQVLKYEYSVDGSPFWNSVEGMPQPLPRDGANGTFTLTSFTGKSSVRIRAITADLVYTSAPYFLSNLAPLSAQLILTESQELGKNDYKLGASSNSKLGMGLPD
ncbi:MAG: hypothetical protein NBV61_08840 [Algoriphagus sp.]|nr:hypothetical protein [Algoriphagus sp.]